MLKKWGVGVLVFLILLGIAYPFIKKDREKDFVLHVNQSPVHMVYVFPKTEIGDGVSVQFDFFQKDRIPFEIQEAALGMDSEFRWESRPVLHKTTAIHRFSIRYQPTKKTLEKTELVLKTDRGTFLLDITGTGEVPRLRVNTLKINGQEAAISWTNRTVYFSAHERPDVLVLDYSLSEPGHVKVGNQVLESGDRVVFDGGFRQPVPIMLSFDTGEMVTYNIQLTNLPVIVLDSPKLSFFEKKSAVFSYISAKKNIIDVPASLRIRGDTSKAYVKKPFKINLLSTKRKKKIIEKNVQLADLRKDGDWLLNPSYVDRSFLRDRLANDLYNMISRDEKAISSAFVEVLRNGAYQGLYILNERVDKKHLNLDPLHGRLIKKRVEQPQKSNFDFGFIDRSPNHDGYYLQFPKTKFMPRDVVAFLNFCSQSSDAQFSKDIHRWMNMDKVIDYHIWSLATAVTDSGHKNYFIAKRNTSKKFFFVPWDADVSFGVLPFYQRTAPTQLPYLNPILARIWELNPDDYRQKLKTRWFALRKGILHDQVLSSRIDTYVGIVSKSEAAKRNFEAVQYPSGMNEYPIYEADIVYIKTWIPAHLRYIDAWLAMGSNPSTPLRDQR